MKKTTQIAILLLLALFVGCTPKAPVQTGIPSQEMAFQVTILHFNDLHGHLKPDVADGQSHGGVARLAARIDQIRKEKQAQKIPTLLLFGGDLQTGTRINEYYQGTASRDLLNRMNPAAAVVGNHEFDHGMEAFVRVVSESNFPWLASNLKLSQPVANLLPEKIILLENGLRVGIVGVTTKETGSKDRPVYEPKVERIDRADDRSDLLVLLSHSGKDCDRYMAETFGNRVDLIIGAHNHVLLTPQDRQSDVVPIVQAGSYGHYLGQADMTISQDRVTRLQYTLHPIDESVAEDPQIADMVQDFEARMPTREERIIGQTRELLDGEREAIRRGETNLGDFVCDLIRTEFLTGADIVLLNSGGFRTSLQQGPISAEDVREVFPFDNFLYSVDVTGKELIRILNAMVAGNPIDNPGHFPQVSGLRFEIDGRRVVEETLSVGGKPLDFDRTYRLVINDFIAQAELEFSVFNELKNSPAPVSQYAQGYRKETLADLLIRYIEKTGTIEKKTDGRISRIADWIPSPGEEQPCWEKQEPDSEEATDKAA